MFCKVIIDEVGQTCNRFWSYLDTVSWAIHFKKKVYIIYWDPSIRFYDLLRNNKYVSFPFYNKKLMNLIGEEKYNRYIHKIFHNILFNYFFAHVHSICGIEFVRGWELRECNKYYPAVKDKANKLFLPNIDIVEKVNYVFDNEKKVFDLIVGVHIRKGDYKVWQNGKFYYEDDIYDFYMTQIESKFVNEKVSFFLSTNGDISDVIINNHHTFRITNGCMAHDLYGLSICDYIIGPPSTFSKWASLIGGVPLYHIYDSSSIIDVSAMSPLVSHTIFANGKKSRM